MKSYFFMCIVISLTLVVFARHKTIYKYKPEVDNFNWNLCKALHDAEKNNAVISSISVKLMLLMLYEGALGNTSDQIRRVAGFSGNKTNDRTTYSQKLQSLQSHEKDDYEFEIGTKLFIDKRAHPSILFLEIINQWYNSSYKEVDFNQSEDAVNSINEWAKNITHGHIQNLITEAETKENTLLILLNAIYFKGYWTTPFNINLTKVDKFYLNSKTTVDVPLMTVIDKFEISKIDSLDSRIITLPYKGNKFVMYIILPNSKEGLDVLIKKINPSVLSKSIKNMQTLNTKVILPKFNFEYTSVLGPILQKLGITDMFGAKSNLTNLGSGPLGNLKVSNVLQKAGLEVNEQGSTAHVVTEVDLDSRFGTPIEAVFEVKRPFLFLIEDITSDTIAFVGKVTNPLSHGSPIVSIPQTNTPNQTQIKHVWEDGNEKICLGVDNFQPSFTYFDSELFQELGLNQLNSNFAVSPASIKNILSLLSEGAHGHTLEQLKAILRLPNDQSKLHKLLHLNQLSMNSDTINLKIVNNIFVNNKHNISINFKDIANNFYSAYISEINFQNIDESIKLINEKISADTKGLINNIVSNDDFDGTTELLLANVLYFKGDWLVEFNESKTKSQCFYTKQKLCTNVNMMNLEYKLKHGYIININAQAVELVYKDENFSMIVILPDEDISLLQLVKNLQHNNLSMILNSLEQNHVDLYLPRFKIDYSTKLSTVLKKMGLISIFEWNANISSIFDPKKNIHVKDITHKVTVEINEKGSIASAVTVANVMTLSCIPELKKVTMNVNRPFVFYIINRITQTTLFSGQVHNISA
ncbi:Serpin domain,Serpin, conserved site [Cinara cedri]|uniref:Serpin domain,Serpin, conserved site n=1 Tax=Cinara cedri TaxID=506608 RepID=A0A5E4M4T5_9HEMI|nr:Serpin domain,Serpin, conserved site [Cinara cedri]